MAYSSSLAELKSVRRFLRSKINAWLLGAIDMVRLSWLYSQANLQTDAVTKTTGAMNV